MYTLYLLSSNNNSIVIIMDPVTVTRHDDRSDDDFATFRLSKNASLYRPLNRPSPVPHTQYVMSFKTPDEGSTMVIHYIYMYIKVSRGYRVHTGSHMVLFSFSPPIVS